MVYPGESMIQYSETTICISSERSWVNNLKFATKNEYEISDQNTNKIPNRSKQKTGIIMAFF